MLTILLVREFSLSIKIEKYSFDLCIHLLFLLPTIANDCSLSFISPKGSDHFTIKYTLGPEGYIFNDIII